MTYIRRLILALALSAGLAPAFAQVAPPVPALPDTERRTSYSITASTCACNVGFALYGDSTDYANWIEVFVNGVRMTQAGNWTLSSATGTIGSIPLPITNAVLTFTAPQTGTIQIVGARRPRRTSQFNEGAGVPTRNFNVVLSDLTAQNRELWDKTNDVTGRALMSQPGVTLGLLPLPSVCASGFLGFDATGLNPLCLPGGAGSGNVLGPLTSTIGDVALFANATGTLLSDAGGGAVSHPIAHPSSGNLVGSGCITAEAHSLWWIDQNLCSTSDVWQITSSDPSAVFTAIIGGTRTTGDKVTLNFTFGSGVCIAGATPACDASYTAIGGDTLQNIANGLVCAIANNPNLFTINGGSCSGGGVTPAAGQSFGGYASGSMIGYVIQITNGVAFDFNSTIALKVTSSVTGAATETVTIGNTTCGTRCSYSLDNNPAIQLVRKSGGAPQPGSTLAAIYSIGASTDCPTSICVNYGNITNWVGNSTSGALKSAWLFQTPSVTGAFAGGLWIGQGAYMNAGGAPFSATASKDMGANSFNVGPLGCYYVGYTNSVNGDSICQNGSGQLIITTNTDNIILSSATGVGINTSPTGNTLNSALGAFVSGTQVPTTGQGISIAGGATPVLSARDYGAAANLPLSIAALYLSSNEVAAPGSPAASNGRVWIDSTDHRLHDKNPSGTIGTTVVADTGASNNFLTAISAAGVVSKAQPSAANLSNGTTGTGAVVLANAPSFTAAPTAPGASLTGQLSVTYGSANFTLQDTGTSFAYFQIIGSGGGTPARMRIGSESTAGGALFGGSAANAGVFGTVDNNPVQFFTNNTLRGGFSNAGVFSLAAAVASTSSTTGTEVITGGLGVSGAIYGGAEITTGIVAVASLPTCNAAHKGSRHFVNDNNTALAFAAVITTGGAIQTPVYCDGTVWRQG